MEMFELRHTYEFTVPSQTEPDNPCHFRIEILQETEEEYFTFRIWRLEPFKLEVWDPSRDVPLRRVERVLVVDHSFDWPRIMAETEEEALAKVLERMSAMLPVP